ncbi:TAXI family TRAP transporter solute-binding subunit [Photobacterium lutimaris]|uniref:C4-dicarboxylate ABC transporter substrate-binding protein n=1 Tax=Photobacterium lutimaris TaxID=388278 RepID=A0A2T3J0M3_9GAMM|nr:TAXI family TRAP transporter solute-binding subunit [Photobacterium lutimaris]PSU34597.1 C4-dicarboxylate ABC transporter substrate-binding protein [Photobacterium lutimaris]TDR71563.1 hypothetical protein DFP78_11697 [Photobacterium lutimaris]
MSWRVFALSFIGGTLLSLSSVSHAQSFVTIGTGGVTGVYYPAGGAICLLVNQDRKRHGVRCSVESTDGSIHNINSIRTGDLELGIAQSDWQYHAYNGTSKFEDKGPFKSLRALFSIHPEPFTVVARTDSGIKNIEDLTGKRVNIGNPGSGQRGTMALLMKAYNWTEKDFALVSELKASEQSRALCDNKIDAIVYTVGHPSGAIKEATTACESVIVNVSGPVVDKLIEENSFYRRTTVPGGMYRGNASDVQTFGVGATFVSSVAVDEKIIYDIVKSVFDNFDHFKKLHPAFVILNKEEIVTGGLTAPLHDGARKYYLETGLIQEE